MANRIPYFEKIKVPRDKWFLQYRQVIKGLTHHALLESGRGGRFSMFGLHPIATLKGKNGELEVTENNKQTVYKGNPLKLMKNWMKSQEVEIHPELPSFQGGAIGYISYDYARYIEKLPELSQDDLNMPDLYFMAFNEVFMYDHEEELLYIITIAEKNEKESAQTKLNELSLLWNNSINQITESDGIQRDGQSKDIMVSLTEQQFKTAVEQIKEYIAQGDIFQVNLSVRQAQALQTDPFGVYECLREVNPSPYMSYIQTPDLQIVSGSPELLVKKDGNEVSTRPIAGTRSRGKDFEEDEKLARELIENEKERAEHVMLVDLERNDLGKVCQYGTVIVDEFMVIERYSHVMHIVSNVKGTLFEHYDAYDVIDAVFPGGTITGAPKVRTMEIIEELEPVRRAIYTGSIGWIGYNGNMELNIAIRTMAVQDGIAYIQAGAGVVIDSNPAFEYKESLKKAKALWKAKELAEQNSKVLEKVE